MLSLILPAFNEARRLPASLARCAEFFRARGLAAEIIVADDGSTDTTAAAYAATVESLSRTQLRYRYLELEHGGKGHAVRAGVLSVYLMHASGAEGFAAAARQLDLLPSIRPR